MSLLGMPGRRPQVQTTYYMPCDLYDETDYADHPVLVVGLDPAARMALVVTRTTKPHAKGPKAVPHAPDSDLDLDSMGWWRLHRVHRVPWVAFDDPDVEVRGRLDDATWERVQREMSRKEDDA